jgi:hypothetical protein
MQLQRRKLATEGVQERHGDRVEGTVARCHRGTVRGRHG